MVEELESFLFESRTSEDKERAEELSEEFFGTANTRMIQNSLQSMPKKQLETLYDRAFSS